MFFRYPIFVVIAYFLLSYGTFLHNLSHWRYKANSIVLHQFCKENVIEFQLDTNQVAQTFNLQLQGAGRTSNRKNMQEKIANCDFQPSGKSFREAQSFNLSLRRE
jgi:hypothetical protein